MLKAGRRYRPIGCCIEASPPDLAPVHLASIQMREHAEFRRVKRILLLGIFRCNYKFASVNGGTRRFEVGLIRYIVKKSGPACQVLRMGIGGVSG